MKISKPEILSQDDKIVYSVRIESSKGVNTLWYSLEKQFGNLITHFSDAPVLALLIPAMENSEDIYI